MKELYMICNAHIDPVWLWQRQEGIAEAISTFRVAARFCEEYEGFVFNHNESLLYEWVEQYEPALFERIQRLVKEGKWRIMGGWYLQPDCNVPCGESFLRQIEVGNRYFMEKFGVKPTTAINFDPFGHSRGLVQILAKTGYDSYVFMRPIDMIPEHNFVWKGYDGSTVIGHCMKGVYSSSKGKILEKLETFLGEDYKEDSLMFWGIGNHGGGPSKEDMDTIVQYQKDHPEVKLLHSYCEEYFSKVDREKLRVVDTSLVHCMMGCYTSMVRIKQMHRMLENELAVCEKMLAASKLPYDAKRLEEAEKAMLFCEFHDILPGTMIRSAEEDALRLLNHGREIVAEYCDKAFFKLCAGQQEAKQGEIPVLVFNPHPYEIEQEVEVEFNMADQNRTPNEVTLVRVRDEEGNYLLSQNEKEECTFHLDWRKKVAFRAQLKPMSINRFDCELHKETVQGCKRVIEPCQEEGNYYIFKNEKMHVLINKKTGLLDQYQVEGRDFLKDRSARIGVYFDNEDPWRMRVDGFYEKIGEMTLLSAEEANAFRGYPEETLGNVSVIENGAVRTKIQAIFRYSNSFAIVTYTLPKKDTYIDIKIKMLSNDANKMYKLSFDTTLEEGNFVGQAVFGREELLQEEKEVTFQKWCALEQDGKNFVVLNKGTYGGSAKDGQMNLSLLRTPIYSSHPIEEEILPDRIIDYPLAETDRVHEHIDMGEREFEYRLMIDETYPDAKAEVYNQPCYTLSFFPSGDGCAECNTVELDDKDVILTAFKRDKEGKLIARLYNSTDKGKTASLKVEGREYLCELGAFEFQTVKIET